MGICKRENSKNPPSFLLKNTREGGFLYTKNMTLVTLNHHTDNDRRDMMMHVEQKYNYKVLECNEMEYAIIGKAVKEHMKEMIEYYEEEIAEAEAYAMNSMYRGIWDIKIERLKKEYAVMLASTSAILVKYQHEEVTV